MAIDPIVLSKVKSTILLRFKNVETYDQADVGLISDNDFLLERLLLNCKEVSREDLVKLGVDIIDNFLKLRSEYSMSSIVSTQIPRDIYELNMYEFGIDRYGQKVVVLNLCLFYDMTKIVKEECFIVWTELFFRSINSKEQVLLLMDMSQVSMTMKNKFDNTVNLFHIS